MRTKPTEVSPRSTNGVSRTTIRPALGVDRLDRVHPDDRLRPLRSHGQRPRPVPARAELVERATTISPTSPSPVSTLHALTFEQPRRSLRSVAVRSSSSRATSRGWRHSRVAGSSLPRPSGYPPERAHVIPEPGETWMCHPAARRQEPTRTRGATPKNTSFGATMVQLPPHAFRMTSQISEGAVGRGGRRPPLPTLLVLRPRHAADECGDRPKRRHTKVQAAISSGSSFRVGLMRT